jgi:polyphosphate kinase
MQTPISDEAATVAGVPAEVQATTAERHTSPLPQNFSLDAPKLPKEIEDAAMRSGGYAYDKRMKRLKSSFSLFRASS